MKDNIWKILAVLFFMLSVTQFLLGYKQNKDLEKISIQLKQELQNNLINMDKLIQDNYILSEKINNNELEVKKINSEKNKLSLELKEYIKICEEKEKNLLDVQQKYQDSLDTIYLLNINDKVSRKYKV
jgi:hypothetical protein